MNTGQNTCTNFINLLSKRLLPFEQVTVTIVNHFWFLHCRVKLFVNFLAGSTNLAFAKELAIWQVSSASRTDG
jgi:hypothetical protein